jgi:CRP-like cAMP-binding protein
VISEGEPGSYLYFIGSGRVSLHHDDEEKCICSAGSFFGETALLWDTKQPVSVVTVTDCEFFTITAEAFRRIFKVIVTMRVAMSVECDVHSLMYLCVVM